MMTKTRKKKIAKRELKSAGDKIQLKSKAVIKERLNILFNGFF